MQFIQPDDNLIIREDCRPRRAVQWCLPGFACYRETYIDLDNPGQVHAYRVGVAPDREKAYEWLQTGNDSLLLQVTPPDDAQAHLDAFVR